MHAWDWRYEAMWINERTACMVGMWCRERKGGGMKNGRVHGGMRHGYEEDMMEEAWVNGDVGFEG